MTEAKESGGVAVRGFTLADLPATRALCDRLRAADPCVEPFGERLAELAEGPRALTSLWRVAQRAGGTLHGICFAALREESAARTSVELYAAVMPAVRRRGLGSQLLAPVIAWARERSGGAARLPAAPVAPVAPVPVALRTRVPDLPEAHGTQRFLAALGFSRTGVQLSLRGSCQRAPATRVDPALSVRPLDPRDPAAVFAFSGLSEAAWEGSPDAFPAREGEAARAAADPGRLILLAVHGREAAGYLSALRLDGALAIDGVAVLPRFRRRGIGRELVVAALRASAGRCRSALLAVREDNLSARALYRSLGFEMSGRRFMFERVE